MKTINLKLKELRNKNNLKQADIAKLLDISIPAYNQKENGKRPFTVYECKIISELFGKPIEEIFFEQEVNTNETKTHNQTA